MKRTATRIYLESPNATTPIPWVNNAPDFSGIENPTLSALVNAWNTFLSSGQELEIIPDPEPVPEIVVPNWQGFGGTLQQSSLYLENATNPFLLTITAFIIQFAGSGDNPALYSSFAVAWGGFTQSIGGLSSDKIDLINNACETFNMKFIIGQSGEIIFI